MTGGTVSLLMACAAFVTAEWATFRNATVEEMITLADIIGYNCAASLTLNDSTDAKGILESLERQLHIDSACVYDAEGGIFTDWIRPLAETTIPSSPPGVYEHRFERDHLLLFRDIEWGEEKIGTVYLRTDLTAMNARLKRYAGIVILILLVSLLVTWRISSRLQSIISEPIFNLLSTTEMVARDQNFTIRAQSHGEDELGTLVKGFNNMLAQIQTRDTALQQAQDNLEKKVEERTRELKLEIEEREQAEKKLTALHRELVETSRQAGMAEVATGVLHNVGNVLNSVNVSTILIGERIRRSKTSNLRKIASLIQGHSDDVGEFLRHDEKGKLLAPYILDLAEHLSAEQKETLSELNSLTANIEHIKEIVAMQQSYASVSGIIESLPIADLADDALRMYENGFHSKEIRVVRRYVETPVISVDKHRAMQILANLVANAQDSLIESDSADRRITVETMLAQNDRVRITVSDNGVGIHPDNLTRIFSHGFTTKRDGHGFGLHYGALAAHGMGGKLSATSEGEGKGARFVLELPLVSPDQEPDTGSGSSR